MLFEGAWENQGLGIVKSVGDELVWTYTASHLGHWIAALLPSSNGTWLIFMSSASGLLCWLTCQSRLYVHLYMLPFRLPGTWKLVGFPVIPHLPADGNSGRNAGYCGWISFLAAVSLRVRNLLRNKSIRLNWQYVEHIFLSSIVRITFLCTVYKNNALNAG